MNFFSKLIVIFLMTLNVAFANVNVNSAGVSELRQFPGVGKVIAQRIIDYRSTNGPFGECDDLIKVKGIGAKTMAKIKPLCHVGDGKAAKTTAKTTAKAPSKPNAVDFNTATAAELIKIKGIGKKMAAKIIDDRSSKGLFSSCDDLLRIKGIGGGTLKKIKPHCMVTSKK